jgi:hypothetical protein
MTTPARKTLDVWPRLPIIISDWAVARLGEVNIIAAHEHHDRVSGKLNQTLGCNRFCVKTTLHSDAGIFPVLKFLLLFVSIRPRCLPVLFWWIRPTSMVPHLAGQSISDTTNFSSVSP